MTKVLLYSGGTDSWLIEKLWKPDKKIYINIHGFYSDAEIAKLPDDVEVLDFGMQPQGQNVLIAELPVELLQIKIIEDIVVSFLIPEGRSVENDFFIWGNVISIA